MERYSKLLLAFIALGLISLTNAPAHAASWAPPVFKGCSTNGGKFSALLVKKFSENADKACKRTKIKYKGKRYRPSNCRRNALNLVVGDFVMPTGLCPKIHGGPTILPPKVDQIEPEEGLPFSLEFIEAAQNLFVEIEQAGDYDRLKNAINAGDVDGAAGIITSKPGFEKVMNEAEEEGAKTFTISPAVDGSIAVGAGGEAGIAFAVQPTIWSKPKLFATGFVSYGVSVAAGGNISFGLYDAKNFCLAGTSVGNTSAGAVGLDISVTRWYPNATDALTFQNKIGGSFSVGAGVGIEIRERQIAKTVQFQSEEEKEACE